MKKPNGIFITGTDTGVGKTIISAALLCALKSTGVDAIYMKPVQTGCQRQGKKLIAPDLDFVLSVSGFLPSEKERGLLAPYCFCRACSPHLAAKTEKKPISLTKIKNIFKNLTRQHDFVVVEGAGGILTPLSSKQTMLDLAKALDLPIIVVAHPGLGTINHTLLTLHILKEAGLKVLGVVLNYSTNTKKGLIEKNNKDTLEHTGKTRAVYEFPFIADCCSKQAFSRKTAKFAKALKHEFPIGKI